MVVFHLFDTGGNRAFYLGEGRWRGLVCDRETHASPRATLHELLRCRRQGRVDYESLVKDWQKALDVAPAVHAFIVTATGLVELHERVVPGRYDDDFDEDVVELACPGEVCVLTRFMGVSVEEDPFGDVVGERIVAAQAELRELWRVL